MQPDPEKVTEEDVNELHVSLKHLVDTVNGTRKYDLYEATLERSVTSGKPRIRSKFISKWAGYNGNIPTYEFVNYVLGDLDGTWEKLLEWHEKLLVRVKRVQRAKNRMRRIKDRVGEEDFLWFLQIGLPSHLIDENGDIP
jgi:hypothetical protein